MSEQFVSIPYRAIWRNINRGRVIPFLGAGASRSLGTPEEGEEDQTPVFLPSGVELANLLAEEANFPVEAKEERDNLSKVSSYLVEVSGRRTLREILREELNRDFPPGQIHNLLASIEQPQLIVVTNYDTLLEKAFQAAGRPYDLVVYPAESNTHKNSLLWWPHGEDRPEFATANELDIDLESQTVIYKIHGSIFHETDEWDHFVITEEDYVEFISGIDRKGGVAVPPVFVEHIIDSSFLFLGYSLRDWNVRVILQKLSKHVGKMRDDENYKLESWGIQKDPTEWERHLWLKRHVNIYNADIDDFVRGMEAARR